MTSLGNTLVGLAFVSVAGILTFLMFYLWKFPFDHAKLKSGAPLALIRLHRILGVVYILIYLYLMYQMVPRLWTYQIELPARTVVHLCLGILIGAILLTKLSIVRFFKHMEARLVPALGVSLFISSFLLVSLTLPFSLREAYLQNAALGEDEMSEERIERVRELLPTVGLEDAVLLDQLGTRAGLDKGRRALQTKCVQCHDLRTVLARPRTPLGWKQTVERMANRSTILEPITEQDQWYVTAYLIAVSPTLQETFKQRREAAMQVMQSQDAMTMASAMVDDESMDQEYDAGLAKNVFDTTCSQCHAVEQVNNAPPANQQAAIELVRRMVDNGLSASEMDLNIIIRYLNETYGTGKEVIMESTHEIYFDEETGEIEGNAGLSDVSENLLDGELLYSQKGCIACHGQGGRSPISDAYPRLASLGKTYLKTQIQDIKSGVRNNGLTSVMASIVQGLSEQEVDAISEYLSRQE